MLAGGVAVTLQTNHGRAVEATAVEVVVHSLGKALTLLIALLLSSTPVPVHTFVVAAVGQNILWQQVNAQIGEHHGHIGALAVLFCIVASPLAPIALLIVRAAGLLGHIANDTAAHLIGITVQNAGIRVVRRGGHVAGDGKGRNFTAVRICLLFHFTVLAYRLCGITGLAVRTGRQTGGGQQTQTQRQYQQKCGQPFASFCHCNASSLYIFLFSFVHLAAQCHSLL